MPRSFLPISIDALKSKIEKYSNDYCRLTPVVEKDLSKVKFSNENFICEQSSENFTGYHMLSNGLAIFSFQAGGDWEYMIWMCIYFDGKKLRGYIPEKGNTWNTDTKKAYGNDHKADLKNAQKRWPNNYPFNLKCEDDIEPIGNTYEIAKDIIDRIVKKVVKPKNVVVKLVLKPVLGWDKDTIATLINSGCNIPNVGGNVYQGQRIIAQVSNIEIN